MLPRRIDPPLKSIASRWTDSWGPINIEMFDNPKRKQVKNGMPSPVEFGRQMRMRIESV